MIGPHFPSLNAQTPLLQTTPHLLAPCKPAKAAWTYSWLSFEIEKHKNAREVIFLFGSIRNTRILIVGILRQIGVQTKSVPEDLMTFHSEVSGLPSKPQQNRWGDGCFSNDSHQVFWPFHCYWSGLISKGLERLEILWVSRSFEDLSTKSPTQDYQECVM